MPAAEALRGLELTVELAEAPTLEEGEWWAQELEGCEVVDGERHVGTVIGLMELPSCEALEVRLVASGRLTASTGRRAPRRVELLVPMVRDAIRHVDPEGQAHRRGHGRSWGRTDGDRHLHAVPGVV